MRPRVFISQPIPGLALEMLGAVGEVDMGQDHLRVMPKAEYFEHVRRCDCLFHLAHDTVDRAVLEANPKLRVIASQAVTPALVDVAEASRRKIPVTTIPGIMYEVTAELSWALLLATARRLAEAGAMPLAGEGVHRKTLGILGLRPIGKRMARRARGFDMRVLYCDSHRLRPEEEADLGAEYRAMEDLLREADFIALNATFTPATPPFIGARQLALMKPTAVLLNIAGGPAVDERALVDALKAGTLAGAALGFSDAWPRVHPDLLRMERVVVAPYVGAAVRETQARIAVMVAENILAVIRGERPPNLSNPEIYASPGRAIASQPPTGIGSDGLEGGRTTEGSSGVRSVGESIHARTLHRLALRRWAAPAGILVAATLAAVALAPLRPGGPAGTQEPPWAPYLRGVDEALARGDARAAERVWRDAYAAALARRDWEGLIAAGDAWLRIGQERGSRQAAEEKARSIYRVALIRAAKQRSPDGALHAAEAFERLGQRQWAEQATRLAEDIASQWTGRMDAEVVPAGRAAGR